MRLARWAVTSFLGAALATGLATSAAAVPAVGPNDQPVTVFVGTETTEITDALSGEVERSSGEWEYEVLCEGGVCYLPADIVGEEVPVEFGATTVTNFAQRGDPCGGLDWNSAFTVTVELSAETMRIVTDSPSVASECPDVGRVEHAGVRFEFVGTEVGSDVGGPEPGADGLALTPPGGHLLREDVQNGKSTEDVHAGVQGRGGEACRQHGQAGRCCRA